MAITEVTMYRVTCNRCGAGADEDGDFYAWLDTGQAISDAESHDWLINKDGEWCSRCVIYDEDSDDYLPNPEPLAKAGA